MATSDIPATRSSLLMKATTALEKSVLAFDKAVDNSKSLVGMGSGKIPLLLPSTHVTQDVDITDDVLDSIYY